MRRLGAFEAANVSILPWVPQAHRVFTIYSHLLVVIILGHIVNETVDILKVLA
jgi:hypothetical protein